jgi:hypothetical protein
MAQLIDVILAKGQETGGLIKDYAATMNRDAERAAEIADTIRDSLRKQADDLANVVQLVTTQARLGEASMNQQSRHLTEPLNEVMDGFAASTT